MPRKQTKLISGIGVNDADYAIYPTVNGKQIICPFYQKWVSMIKRCYSAKSIQHNPTYKGCTVAPEWFLFMNFRKWMLKQDWRGLHLDKDLLYPGNKRYSPKTCLFIAPKVNALITDRASRRGKYPIGVYKCRTKFISQISLGLGVQVRIGYFNTSEMAALAYNKAKGKYIRSVADKQIDPRVKAGLLRHAKLYEQGLVA